MVVNLRKPHTYPVYNEVSSLVYCARESNVETVVVDGKVIMEDRRMVNINEEETLNEAEGAARELAPAFNISLPK